LALTKNIGDSLNMVKITRPILKSIYLRDRLFRQLDHMRRFPVVWISSSAGSGKTTLVSSYVEQRKLPCLWYQFDHTDNDIATLFYYLGQAANKVSPKKRKPMPLLTPEYYLDVHTFTLRYFEELYKRLKRPFFLVFDNYHEVPDDSPLHEIMFDALSHIPQGINIIVISRRDSPSNFIRLQADQQMDILDWKEIRLTEKEAREMFNLKAKNFFTKGDLDHICKLCDGWAVGLVLYSIAVKREHMESEITGYHTPQEIFAYFTQEIFTHLDQKTRQFFLTTVYLPQMTADMAEELTGNSQAGEILKYMLRNNYFISRQSLSPPVYVYHELYRNFLLAYGRKNLSPETVLDIQRQAAGILQKTDQAESALTLLKEAADWEKISQIIITHGPEMIKQGRYLSLNEWLESLPAEVVKINPSLLYWKGRSLIYFDPLSARTFFEQAFAGFQAGHEFLDCVITAAWIIFAISFSYEGFPALNYWFNIINDFKSKISAFPDEESEAIVIASAINALALGEFPHQDAATCAAWEKRLIDLVETPATLNIKVHSVHILFWYRLMYHGASEALPLLHFMERLCHIARDQPLPLIALRAAEVQYYLISGLHDDMMKSVESGLEISRKSGIHIEEAWFIIHAVVSFINRMDFQSARLWMEKFINAKYIHKWAQMLYHSQLSRLALIRKDLAKSLSEAKLGLELVQKSKTKFNFTIAHYVLAEIFLQMGQRKEALEHLEQSRSYAEHMNCRTFLSIVILGEAYFAFEEGNDIKGRRLLQKSISMARKCGCALGLFGSPAVTMEMLEKALEYEIEVEYVQTIIRRRAIVPDNPPVHIENWPWTIKIYTMGRFTVLINNAPLTFKHKAQQTPLRLLKAIIALGGRDIAGDKLVDFLWPDAEGDMAYHALESTLHRLRKLLGYPEAIVMTDGKITLDNRYCWVDTWAFERLLGQSDACKSTDPLKKKELIEKAVALYHGNFLAGEREEPWLISSSEHLKSKYFKGIWWLVNYLEEQGQWAQAADLCEKFLKVDACREDIYRNLMICHHKMQKKSEALLAYQRCCKILSSVLGISPSGETQTIYKTILSEKN
jgi:DNA-binding SARP family transcriptional activator